MLSYWSLKGKEHILQHFTGLKVKEFNKLLSSFSYVFETELNKKESERKIKRIRKRGGGRKSSIQLIEDKLLFIMFYFRCYPTQEVQGYLFGMNQTQANYWIYYLTPLLNKALGYEAKLPARKPSDIKKIMQECQSLKFIIDGTERPIQRPKDRERQKKYYSGKKKRHTVKNTLITDVISKDILVLSKTCQGKKHDKIDAEEQNYEFPPGSLLWKDTGYQGYEPNGAIGIQPKKKPKGRELNFREKERNKRISKKRIFVEHSIGGVKIYKITRDIYRNHKEYYDDLVMETACGLYNFRNDIRRKIA